jgi:hypothetical protein
MNSVTTEAFRWLYMQATPERKQTIKRAFHL